MMHTYACTRNYRVLQLDAAAHPVDDSDGVEEGEDNQQGTAKQRRRQQHVPHPVRAAKQLVLHARDIARDTWHGQGDVLKFGLSTPQLSG